MKNENLSTPSYESSEIFNLNWGGGPSSGYADYQGYLNSPGVGAPDSGGSPASGPGVPAASPAAGSSGASPGSPGAQGVSPSPATGQPQGGQPASTIDWNTAPQQFRDAYNALQQKHSKYEPLGDPEVVTQHTQFVQAAVNEAYELGEALGYRPEQIEQALGEDVVNTLAFLRQKAQSGQRQQGQQGQQPDIQKLIDKRLAPINEHLNRQLTDAANARFDQTVNQLFSDPILGFPDHSDLPKEYRDLIMEATSEMFKYDEQAIRELKHSGKTAGIAKHFAKAKQIIETGFNAYMQHQIRKQSGGGAPQGGGQGGGNRNANGQFVSQGGQGKPQGGLTLDDVINGTDEAVRAIPSMKR